MKLFVPVRRLCPDCPWFRSVAALLSIAGLGLQAANCPPIAFGPVPFPAKVVPQLAYTYPDTAATADVNRDQHPDLIYCGTAAVYVMRGDGAGNFGAPSNVVSAAATSIALADFNKDGNPDLVLGSTGVNVQVALGNGDGTFKPAVVYSANALGTGTAQYVATADFDGDGVIDIAATLVGANAIGILTGRTNSGTFNAARSVAVTSPQRGLVAGDFNGDGFVDLATGSGATNIAVLLNKGNGTFFAQTNSPVNAPGTVLTSLRVGDLNGDGILDLTIVSGTGSTALRFIALLGNGDGTFRVSDQKTITAPATYSSVLTDINGDGRLDAVIASSTTVTVMEGLGDGTFADPLPFSIASAGGITSGDYDQDGRPDVVIFGGDARARILLNETEFLPSVPAVTWKTGSGPVRLVWYTNYVNYALEYSPQLAQGAAWQPAPGSATTVDCQYFYTVSSNKPGFYRLKKP